MFGSLVQNIKQVCCCICCVALQERFRIISVFFFKEDKHERKGKLIVVCNFIRAVSVTTQVSTWKWMLSFKKRALNLPRNIFCDSFSPFTPSFLSVCFCFVSEIQPETECLLLALGFLFQPQRSKSALFVCETMLLQRIQKTKDP